MAHFDTQFEAIGQRNLKLMFPKTSTVTVAASAVGQYEQLVGVGIFGRANCLPPTSDRGHGKFGGVTTCAQIDESFIAAKIIDAVRNSNSFCIGRKIMIKDFNRFIAPFMSGLMKRTNQFTALGVGGFGILGGVIGYSGFLCPSGACPLTASSWIQQLAHSATASSMAIRLWSDSGWRPYKAMR